MSEVIDMVCRPDCRRLLVCQGRQREEHYAVEGKLYSGAVRLNPADLPQHIDASLPSAFEYLALPGIEDEDF